MIPLKLHIKNFISYGSPTQTIDFTPYHLICLSGKNGHGKSALLDALTWAVWGQARKGLGTSKADEGLLRLGQTNMAVALDFTCNGQTYRVRREFTFERGKGVTQLDFGIIDLATSHMHELTDKTIRATQAKIEQTIGFDYESFINSVFLRQGNSNEFSKKSPKERKEVLAAILGLAKYEALRKQALEKMRDGSVASVHLKKNCELLATETAQAAAFREQLHQLHAQAAQLNRCEQELEVKIKAHAQEKKSLQEQQQKQQQLLFMHDQITKAAQAREQALRELFDTWRSIARKLRASKQQPHSEARKKMLEHELAQMQEVGNKRLAITHEMMQCTAQLQAIKTTLHTQHNEQQQQYLKQCHALESKFSLVQAEHTTSSQAYKEVAEQQAQLAAELEQIASHEKLLEKEKIKLAQQETQLERGKLFYHAWVNRGNKLAQELKKIGAQQTALSAVDAAACPLCEQDLPETRHAHLQQKFQTEERQAQHQLQRLKRLIPQLKELLTQQHQQLETTKKAIVQFQHNVARAEALAAQLAQLATTRTHKESVLKKQADDLKDCSQSLEILHKQKNIFNIPLDALLLGNEEYRATQQRLKSHEQALAEQAYDQHKYDSIKQELAIMTTAHDDHQDLMQQSALQTQRKQEIHALCSELRQQRVEQKKLRMHLAKFAQLPQQIAQHEMQEQQLTQEKQNLAAKKEQIAHQRGSLEQSCSRVAQQEISLKKEQEQLTAIEHDTLEYQILSQALSKDGIQGLLIENVIPEIETEANDLLARLTNNQAQLTIESIRDLKSGGTKETLEIKIEDAVGVRPYELFSGGEAFRIDFALRLAVSKLLARRTGTSLQTLIIDEGFGSQDEEGLNHIMECLYAIQEDFAKIIIVSHLPTMKDQFPVHFYVQKTPRGSAIQVIEQG